MLSIKNAINFYLIAALYVVEPRLLAGICKQLRLPFLTILQKKR